MRMWRWVAIGLLICVSLLQAVEDRKQLEVSLYELPNKLDPHQTTSSFEMLVTIQMFEGLVQFKPLPDRLELEPALATSWKISEDGKSYTFHLRKNVKFHDGTPFDAEAVKFNILHQIDPKHLFYTKDAYFYAGTTYGMVEEVKVLDTYTVQIDLKYPYAAFLANLAMPIGAPMVSPASIKKFATETMHQPVGTGPFQFVSKDEKQIIIERNSEHWEKVKGIERVRFTSEANEDARLLALRSGDSDVMLEGSYTMAEKLHGDDNFNIFRKPLLHIAYLAMNTEKSPLNKVQVRQAINHAINKPSLVKLVMGESATLAKNPIPPGIAGYNDSIIDYVYDVKKAQSLLKEAGMEKGFEATLLYRSNIKSHVKLGTYIKAALGKVGINLRLVPMEWSDMKSVLGNGEFDLAILRWFGDNGDADNFFYPLFSKESAKKPKALNRAFYKSDAAEALIQEGRSEVIPSKREEIYRKLQEIIHHDAPWVPLYHRDDFHFSSSDVERVNYNMLSEVRFQHVRFSE